MVRIVVAGFGNPLRRDDGAGWLVAACTAQRWGDRVVVLMGQQPLPEWAEVFSEADLAYIVDAAVDGSKRMSLRRISAVGDTATPGGHQFCAEDLLTLTRAVYSRTPEAYLLVLPADDVGFGQELSPRTARAVAVALRYLSRRIALLTGPAAQGTSTSTLVSARSECPVSWGTTLTVT